MLPREWEFHQRFEARRRTTCHSNVVTLPDSPPHPGPGRRGWDSCQVTMRAAHRAMPGDRPKRQFSQRENWRRGWDSNPRAGYPTRRFRGAPVTTTSVPLRSCVRALVRLKPVQVRLKPDTTYGGQVRLKPDYVRHVRFPDCRTFNYTCRSPGADGVASRAACRRSWKKSWTSPRHSSSSTPPVTAKR